MYKTFIEAIKQKLVIQLKFVSKEKGEITRMCIPFDFGPSKRYKDGLDRYHFYDLDSSDGKHNLSILPEQIVEISLTDKYFEPRAYITWSPNWYVKRDWDEFS